MCLIEIKQYFQIQKTKERLMLQERCHQKARAIEQALYDETFRACLQKGRARTCVLLAKTKERRLDGGLTDLKLSDGVYLCVEARKRSKSLNPMAFSESFEFIPSVVSCIMDINASCKLPFCKVISLLKLMHFQTTKSDLFNFNHIIKHP